MIFYCCCAFEHPPFLFERKRLSPCGPHTRVPTAFHIRVALPPIPLCPCVRRRLLLSNAVILERLRHTGQWGENIGGFPGCLGDGPGGWLIMTNKASNLHLSSLSLSLPGLPSLFLGLRHALTKIGSSSTLSTRESHSPTPSHGSSAGQSSVGSYPGLVGMPIHDPLIHAMQVPDMPPADRDVV